MLKVTNKKIDFSGIFKKYIENLNKKYASYHSFFYDDDYYDDEYNGLYGNVYDDWWEQYENAKRNKGKKKQKEEDLVWDKTVGEFVPKSQYKKNRKGKKKVYLDNDELDDYTDIVNDNYMNEYKYIYYYSDIDKKSSKMEFNNLFDFDNFITKSDIEITEVDTSYLMRNKLVHCTSVKTLDGKKRLVVDNSYNKLKLSKSEMEHLINVEC